MILKLVILFLLGSMLSAMDPAIAAPSFSPRDLAVIRLNIIDLLAKDPDLPLPVRQRQEALLAYYSDAPGSLLWLGADRTADFVARLRAVDEDGLEPSAYPADQLAILIASADEADKRSRSIIELHFSAALLEYSSDLQVGRFLPRKVDPNFFVQERSIDQLAALKQLAASSSIEQFFLAWQPHASEYAALKAALSDYRALAAAGGWPSVPLGDALKPGMSDERVTALRARLAVTGEATVQAGSDAKLQYDEQLVESVKAFQSRHGLDPDGVVGAATIVALNVPVEERVQEIVVAMERWRWMPENLGNDHIIVNIAGFELNACTTAKSRRGCQSSSESLIAARPCSVMRSDMSNSIPTGTCRRASR